MQLFFFVKELMRSDSLVQLGNQDGIILNNILTIWKILYLNITN